MCWGAVERSREGLSRIRDRRGAKGRKGSEKSGIQSEGSRCGGPSMCIGDKTGRLDAGEAKVLVCEVTYPHHAPEHP